ncbi:MAG: hypothetical protein EOP05_19195, partial [Proteobacteria bacterium]
MRSLFRSSGRPSLVLLALLSPALILGCTKDEPATSNPARNENLGRADETVIYGDDNRHEYFEEVDASVRAL